MASQPLSCKVGVVNRFSSNKPRGYIVCSEKPTISNAPDVYLPVCYNTGKLRENGQGTFTYHKEYYAFIGTRDPDSKKKNTIHTTQVFEKPIKLASRKKDGDLIMAEFPDNAAQLTVVCDRVCRQEGAFTIECSGRHFEREDERTYVVGIVQKFDHGQMVVAAVDYREDTSYVITPAQYLNIRVAQDEISGQLPLENVNEVATIKLLTNNSSITIYENKNAKFVDKDPSKEDTSRSNGFKYGPQAPAGDRQTPQNEQQQQQSTHPPQNARAANSSTPSSASQARQRAQANSVPTEAKNLGFTSRNQYIAYGGFVKFNKDHLANFYKEDELQALAKEVDKWIAELDNVEAAGADTVGKLCLLSLYDCILLLDNSESMIIFEDGQRVQQMISICSMIVQVESILKNTREVRMEFLGQKVPTMVVENLEQVQEELERVFHPENDLTVETTRLGTTLRGKILQKRIYDIARTERPRPLLVSIITDGKPEGEKSTKLQSEMKYCKKELIDRKNLGDKHVVFQISRVGGSAAAKKFIHILSEDDELKGICHCTTYLDINSTGDSDDVLEEYVVPINRLAGAIFANFNRNEDFRKAHSPSGAS